MRRLLLILAVVAGCGILEPDEVCGCPPSLVSTPVTGEVLNSLDEPVSGVRVVTESSPDDADAATPRCSVPGSTMARNETQTNANGEFSTVVRWTGASSCARIWAQTGSGAQLRSSDTTVVPLDVESSSVTLDLVLHLREPVP